MYRLYVDEAGTSANEPVTVVVGIIVHVDITLHIAESVIESLFDYYVPGKIRKNFVFHFKDIMGDRKLKDSWSFKSRLELIDKLLPLIRSMGFGISIGKVRRDTPAEPVIGNLTQSQMQHVTAFGQCLARADKYVRDHGSSDESLEVIAEHVPKMVKYLNLVTQFHKEAYRDYPINNQTVRLTQEEIVSGKISQTPTGRTERIISPVIFLKKGEDPILQLADLGAFVFRRYFAEGRFGLEWITNLLGETPTWEDWQGSKSFYCFRFPSPAIVRVDL